MRLLVPLLAVTLAVDAELEHRGVPARLRRGSGGQARLHRAPHPKPETKTDRRDVVRSKDEASRASCRLDEDQEAWDSVSALVNTISESELNELSLEGLLGSLFPQSSIFLDVPKALEFECTCSTQRTAQALRTMSSTEINEILHIDAVVKVTCEFCGKSYEFDEQGISKLRKIVPLVH